jgi:anti-sigma regulatory factor (Ser/Thr protein kinase)
VADRSGLDVELPRTVRAPAMARAAVRDLCDGDVVGDMLTDAELLVSELVTNALRHGDGQITLRGAVDDDTLMVEVIDEGGGFEHELRRRNFDDVGGWGLGVVDDLASPWGVHEGTTHVWFEIERPGPRLGPDAA